MNNFNLYIDDYSLLTKAIEIAKFTNGIEVICDLKHVTYPYLHLLNNNLLIVNKNSKPYSINDIYNNFNFKHRYLNIENDLLITTIKKSFTSGDILLDLTTGFALDSLIFAKFGINVTMLEFNPFIATIVYYALMNDIIPRNNLKLIFGNSVDFLKNITIKPDFIYLDPMYDDNKKSLSNKHMKLIQETSEVDNPSNNTILFKLGIKLVKKKIIVKRDNKQEFIINEPQPNLIKFGKTIRFDVYNNF